jgi:hypothetical protein
MNIAYMSSLFVKWSLEGSARKSLHFLVKPNQLDQGDLQSNNPT